MTVGTEQREHKALDHVVHFYECDDGLAAVVGAHLAEGLHNGETVVVVATAAHRQGFLEALDAAGIDARSASTAGTLILLDASATLATIRPGGRLDPARFDDTVGALLRDLQAAGRPVRAYGEMVALQWESGDVAGALELEDQWNELADQLAFSLFCAYPLPPDGTAATGPVAEVCRRHSAVVPHQPRPIGHDSLPAGVTSPLTVSQAFPGTGTGVRDARRFALRAVEGWDLDGLCEDTALVVSELASNAVRHSHGDFTTTITITVTGVRIAVGDSGPDLPQMRFPADDEPSGRGVQIVATLANRWGIDIEHDGKVVWAELVT